MLNFIINKFMSGPVLPVLDCITIAAIAASHWIDKKKRNKNRNIYKSNQWAETKLHITIIRFPTIDLSMRKCQQIA